MLELKPNGRAGMLSGFEGGEGGHAASIQTIIIAGGRLKVVSVNGSGSTHSIGYRWDGRSFIRIRETGQAPRNNLKQLTNGPGESGPFFSPDGRWVISSSGNYVSSKVPVEVARSD